MNGNSKIIFDVDSTNPVSVVLAVTAGNCIQINAWGLGVGETAQVFSLLMSPGSVPSGGSSCGPVLNISPNQIIAETAYRPCNLSVEVGQVGSMNLTSLVLQQPGFYRVHLAPAALGTAVVEAIMLEGDEACDRAASQCCCPPVTPTGTSDWNGISQSPCLTIVPGVPGTFIFDIDPCCILTELPDGTFNPDDTIAVVGAGDVCKLVPVDGLVCQLLQGLTELGVPPTPGDLVPIIQASNGQECVLAEWPVVDLCDQMGLLSAGGLIAGDVVLVRELGGTCKLVDASAFGGGVVFPLLGPDGSCLAPTYSFASNPDTGMFLTATELVLGWNNCLSQLNVGDAIEVDASQFFEIFTNNVSRLKIAAVAGEWELPAGSPGTAGQVITSSGIGAPPTWQTPTTSFPLLAPNGSCAAPSYSFTASPDSGMFYTGTAVRIGDDNCVDFIDVGASIVITSTISAVSITAGTTFDTLSTGATTQEANGTFSIIGNGIGITSDIGLALGSGGVTARLTIQTAGDWNLGGSVGTAGQAIVSNGAGVPPTWQTVAGGGVVEPDTQVVYGTGVAVDSESFFTRNVATGSFNVNVTTAGSKPAGIVSPSRVKIWGRDATNTGAAVEVFGGAADVVGGSSGGGVDVRGGAGGQFGSGGQATLTGGAETFVNRGAGLAGVYGGAQTNGTPDTGNRGGNAEVFGGAGGSGASGGDVLIRGGNQGAGVATAQNGVTIGFNGVPGIGTLFSLAANPATNSRWTGGNASVGAVGQALELTSGGGGTSVNAAAGNVFIGTGLPNGTGANGEVHFFNRGVASNRVGRIGPGGDWVLAGVGGSGAGPTDTILAAATTLGFTWLPRVTAAPSGVPVGPYGGWAIPFVAQNNNAGSIILWAYDTVSGGWNSVTLV